MEKLSELDSSFLYLENERTPMHYGGLYVFKKANARSKLDANRLRLIVQQHLPSIPVLRQRLLRQSAANADIPVWADDPNFCIDNHIVDRELEVTQTLNELASEVFSAPLDSSKPLWSICFIDQLQHDKKYSKTHFALVIKAHITTTDALKGGDILSSLLQISPDPMQIGEPEPWNPPPLPPESSWLENAYSSAVNLPSKLTYLAKDTAAIAFYSLLYEQLQKLNLPSSLMSVASTPLNKQVNANRAIETIDVPMDRIRQLRRKFQSVTTNDIVMGICAEALSLYLKDNETEPKLPLIALTPISVRSKSLEVQSGNQLNVALFSLATTEENPVRRIHLIHQSATNSNHYAEAISANRLTELEPSRIAALSARGYCEFLLAQKHKPMFNLPIINIPGPQFPLFLEDAEMEGLYSCSPLFDGIRLAINIISYDGFYHITCTYSPTEGSIPFSKYVNQAIANISTQEIQAEDSLEEDLKKKSGASQSGAALIEDAIGLVSNLLPFSSKSTEKES